MARDSLESLESFNQSSIHIIGFQMTRSGQGNHKIYDYTVPAKTNLCSTFQNDQMDINNETIIDLGGLTRYGQKPLVMLTA